jgi:biotin operon repressor
MNLITATLFPAPIEQPPEISSASEGNIRRNFCAAAPGKAVRARGPRMAQQLADAAETRARIIDLVAGSTHNANSLAEATGKTVRTVWTHINALVDDGVVQVDRSVKPWRFHLARD